MLALLLLLTAPSLVHTSCSRANKYYPNSTLSKPKRVSWESICPADFSCCTLQTERDMISAALSVTDHVYTNLDHHLMMFNNHTMMPEYSIRLLENTTLNYINGTELGLSYTDIFYIIMQRVVQPPCFNEKNLDPLQDVVLDDVRNISNHVYSLQMSLRAVKRFILSVRRYNVSAECVRNLVRNGVPTGQMRRNLNCPVCNDETSQVRTCKSVCSNTVRACYSDLTDVIPDYERLLHWMDTQYLFVKYMMISRFGALANMISAAEKKLGPKCVINNNFAKDYRDSTNYLNKYPQYYSISKGLSGIFNTPEAGPCALSDDTSNCWTDRGLRYDDTFIRSFSKQAQLTNPIMPYVATTEVIRDCKLDIRIAAAISAKAQRNASIFSELRGKSRFSVIVNSAGGVTTDFIKIFVAFTLSFLV